jgi:alkylation response protein AidB-like acyl-CoA dehydrogenase
MTDLLYSEVEEDLRASVRALLADRSPWSQVLKRIETPDTYDMVLWRSLAVDLGLAGLLVPERLDGAGVGHREAAVVCEELGRAVAPVPFLGSAVIATSVLLSCGTPEAESLVAAMARGERTAALAVPFATSAGGVAWAVADAVGIVDGRASGRVSGVADALAASVLLVPTRDGLWAVDTAAATLTAVTSLDMTRQLADVLFNASPARLVAAGAIAREAIDAGLRAGAGLIASEQLGVASWCLDTTVEYLRTRYQFGRPIGSYQALKHRIADVWVDVTQARAAARYAADCLATDDPDTAIAVSLAKAYVSPVAVRTAEECLQLHGGIGFTWEHPMHLYLKRAKADAIALGTADTHRETLGTLIDIAPPA